MSVPLKYKVVLLENTQFHANSLRMSFWSPGLSGMKREGIRELPCSLRLLPLTHSWILSSNILTLSRLCSLFSLHISCDLTYSRVVLVTRCTSFMWVDLSLFLCLACRFLFFSECASLRVSMCEKKVFVCFEVLCGFILSLDHLLTVFMYLYIEWKSRQYMQAYIQY